MGVCHHSKETKHWTGGAEIFSLTNLDE